MLGYEAVGDTLQRLGVRQFFGLMGRANMRFLIHMVRECGIPYVAARHETAAVSMADAYARATGGLGVCTVTLGPGVTHCLTGMVEATRGRTPLLLLSGAPAADHPGDGQFLDQLPLFRAAGVATRTISSPATLRDDLRAAAQLALDDRRPVAVPVPLDLQSRQVPDAGGPVGPVTVRPGSPADEAAIAAAADVAGRAERPLVLAGRGAMTDAARDALIRLADRVGALLATTVHAAGLFADHPFSLGIIGVHGQPGAARLLAEADTVLAFGATLNRFTTCGGHLFPAVRDIVHCEVDGGTTASAPVTVRMTGDAAATAEALVDALTRLGTVGTGYRTPQVRRALSAAGGRAADDVGDAPDAVAPDRTAGDSEGNGTVEPTSLLALLDRWLPRDRMVAPEPSDACGDAIQCLPVFEARHGIYLCDFQSIGLGLAAAVGAAVARPDRITVAAVGDGGTMMALGEIETMVRYRLPVLVLVLNNSAYGAEARELQMQGLPVEAARFPPVDLAAVARGLGAAGVTVRSLADLAAVREWIRQPAGPLVADCKLDLGAPARWFTAAIGTPDASLRRPRPEFLPTPRPGRTSA